MDPRIEAALAELGDVVQRIVTIPPTPPWVGAWPTGIAAPVQEIFAGAGIPAPWSHQAEAMAALLAGKDAVLTSPTASGKSLPWMAVALHELLAESGATVLYLAPTKALARDQAAALAPLATALLPGEPEVVRAVDGDAAPTERAAARRRGRVLLTNPETLHLALLPSHPRWARFLAGLRLVVLDEAHQVRGLFGAHVANLLWRLRRLVSHHGGGGFRVLAASATIASPGEHVAQLVGRPVLEIAGEGALRGPQVLALGEPALSHPALGIRRTLQEEAVRAAAILQGAGLRTLVFVRSRGAAEEATAALRQALGTAGAARAYRAGLTAATRREVETGLRRGEAAVVVSTSALELGVDPGPVDACVIAGYPGSLASFRQQAGRAGRRGRPSLVLFLAGPAGLDRYLLGRPEVLLGGALPRARCDPGNPLVRLAHLGCAAYELPVVGAEGDDLVLLAALSARGEARAETTREGGTAWRWIAATAPAPSVGLRQGEGRAVEVWLAPEGTPPRGRRRLLGTVDALEAPARIHPGAVYLHDGRAYRVTELDSNAAKAWAAPEPGPRRTAVKEAREVTLCRLRAEAVRPGATVGHGLVAFERRVEAFREWDRETGILLREATLDLPARRREVAALWVAPDEALRGRLERAGWWTPEAVRQGQRGPGWDATRQRVRARDRHRCRHCGAPEAEGRAHDVHHLQPFRTFGWVPGVNQAHLEANRLENLALLCPACHRRAEQGVRSEGLLSRLAGLLAQVAPLRVLCDPRDLEVLALPPEEAVGWPKGPEGETAPVRLLVAERAEAGAGLAEALYRDVDALLAEAARLLQSCGCDRGCPACAGPPDDRLEAPREALAALLAGLRGASADPRESLPRGDA